MRDGNGGDASNAGEQIDGCLIDQADAVPQHVAARGLHEERALPDRELRHRAYAHQTRLEPAEAVPMRPPQCVQRGPCLSRRRHVLA
jgi:hypothetical protein